MKTLMRAAVILFATIPARDASASDLCQDPRIPPPGAAGRCETYSLRYADGGTETDVQLAKVFRQQVRHSDLIIREYEHYLRRPDGEIVSLGQFLQEFSYDGETQGISGHAEWLLLKGLDIDDGAPRGIFPTDINVFFDQRLEHVRHPHLPDRYCMTYRMKPPFEGWFQDCDGSKGTAGTVGYAAGTVTWLQAKQRACLAGLSDAIEQCVHSQSISYRIARNADGGLFYVFTVSRPSFWGTVYLVYRIDAASGALSMLQETHDSQQAWEWQRHGHGAPTTWIRTLGRFGWVPFGAPFLLFGLLAWHARRRRRQIGVPLEQSGRSA